MSGVPNDIFLLAKGELESAEEPKSSSSKLVLPENLMEANGSVGEVGGKGCSAWF